MDKVKQKRAENEPEVEEKPSWITQTREEVAEAELEAAATHYTWLALIEDGTATAEDISHVGDAKWQEYWWKKHMESAWYNAPSYTESRLGG